MQDWNDDRLDGLDGNVKTQAQAITYLSLKVNTLETELRHLKDTAKDKATGKFNYWMILATVSNSLTGLVVYLISKGGH